MSKRSKYSPEFKEQAIKRTLSGSFTIKEVSRSLGISYFVLRQWRAEYMKKSEEQLPLTDKQLKESEELKKLRKENLKLKEEVTIPKKVCSHAFPRTKSRLMFMETHRFAFSIRSMANVLEVSRSGFYQFLKRSKNELEKYNPELVEFIKETWLTNRKNYGLVRLLREVKKVYSIYGARTVRKVMKLCEIRGKQEKRFRIATTNSNHGNRVAPDLVQRNFKPNQKNRIWVSDITFLRSSLGWIYLCVILDLYSRKVVGWSISNANDSKLVCTALSKAIECRNPPKGLVFHSDRGSNYCSNETRKYLLSNKIRRSNSRKGNCWDNAVAESFFGSLKREIEFNYFYRIQEAQELLFDHIEVYYNRQRSHSFLGYVSPVEFEECAA
ncbi:IS3 family transposase [Leptospira santarosai]|uniref:IS3 family transposase n=1 Tax=Leptospira santarosai TaxID=28183 RepID=UPI0024AFEBB2|nr:IS3 family transposase [Leptospira santarosai]MBW9231293.1 IS3 family transposase [Leptospira santarosai]MDI7175407.1 IS3 family transposase [Leptospira santarosai]MDI7195084.1 IS3 family transposase [Leptospira santarosai]MDO6393864.1 IS3 family transposase [Leptospira santarosai]MDO6399459.1 IS3 family transposase [Leptospira santarosai]